MFDELISLILSLLEIPLAEGMAPKKKVLVPVHTPSFFMTLLFLSHSNDFPHLFHPQPFSKIVI